MNNRVSPDDGQDPGAEQLLQDKGESGAEIQVNTSQSAGYTDTVNNQDTALSTQQFQAPVAQAQQPALRVDEMKPDVAGTDEPSVEVGDQGQRSGRLNPYHYRAPRILQFQRSEEITEKHDDIQLNQTDDDAITVTEDVNTARELEKLQIKTIFALVDFLTIDEGGKDVNKAMLFLTNKQALELDVSDHERLLRAMDVVHEPKLVINLLSTYSWCHMIGGDPGSVLECHWAMRNELGRLELSFTPELLNEYFWISEEKGLAGLQESELRLSNFLKSCVLPLARENQALVVVSDNKCSLSRSFCEICEEESGLRGGELGFSTFLFGNADAFEPNTTNKPGTTARDLKLGCARWRKRSEHTRLAQQRHRVRGQEMKCYFTGNVDAPRGCTHFILTDTVNESSGQLDWGAVRKLKANLSQQLASNLPSVSIATYFTPWTLMATVQAFADVVGRGLPLLLLDCRPPIPRNFGKSKGMSFTQASSTGSQLETLKELVKDYDGDIQALANDYLQDLEDRLCAAGTTNFYHACTLAFLHSLLTTKHYRKSKVVDLGQSDRSIYAVIQAYEKDKKAAEDEHEANAEFLNSEQEKQKDARLLAQTFMEHATYRLQSFTKVMFRIYDKHVEFVKACETPEELDHVVTQMSLHGAFRAILPSLVSIDKIGDPGLFVKFEAFRNLRAGNGYVIERGMRGDVLWSKLVRFKGTAGQLPEARDMLLQRIELIREMSAKDGPHELQAEAGIHHSNEIQKGVVTILTSKKTFSGNLSDTARLERMMVQIPNLNRLPEQNEFTTMELFRNAWDSVDLYTHEAAWAKVFAKVSYYMLLLLGFSVSALTVTSLNRPEFLNEDTMSYLVTGLSLATSFVAGVITIVNPVTRWQQLRAAALSMESEMWVFRTRSGPYRISIVNDHKSVEDKLHDALDTIKQNALKAAGIRETSFASRLALFGDHSRPSLPKVFRHGQYQNSLKDGTYGRADPDEDDHHTPLTPDSYLLLRVQNQMKFYQLKLPHNMHIRRTSQVLLMLGAIAATLLSTISLSTWAGLCTSITAIITAIAEFNGTEKKLSRYSDTLNQLDRIILWWRCLPSVERASVAKISMLILGCEECFRNEWNSWASTSTANKAISAAEVDDEATGEQGKAKRE